MNSLSRKELCQSPDPTASNFAPSFAAVTAGVDKNTGKEHTTDAACLRASILSSKVIHVAVTCSLQTCRLSVCLKRRGRLHPSPSPMSSDTTAPKHCPTYLRPPAPGPPGTSTFIVCLTTLEPLIVGAVVSKQAEGPFLHKRLFVVIVVSIYFLCSSCVFH